VASGMLPLLGSPQRVVVRSARQLAATDRRRARSRAGRGPPGPNSGQVRKLPQDPSWFAFQQSRDAERHSSATLVFFFSWGSRNRCESPPALPRRAMPNGVAQSSTPRAPLPRHHVGERPDAASPPSKEAQCPSSRLTTSATCLVVLAAGRADGANRTRPAPMTHSAESTRPPTANHRTRRASRPQRHWWKFWGGVRLESRAPAIRVLIAVRLVKAAAFRVGADGGLGRNSDVPNMG